MPGYAEAHAEASLIAVRISIENKEGSTFYPKPKSTEQDSYEALLTFLKARRKKVESLATSLPNLDEAERKGGNHKEDGPNSLPAPKFCPIKN